MPDDALSPADAFSLLADETRLGIVEALVDSAFESMGDPVSFSDLRRLVGVDDAGKFNYHLGKLQPQFIEKQDDGYVPRFAALEAVGAARAGTFTELPEERRAELDRECRACEEPLTAIHEGSRIQVKCDEHGGYFQSIVPPRTAANRSVAEVVRFASRDTQREIEKLVDGVCMICGGSVETTIPAEPTEEDIAGEHVMAGLNCTNCAYRMMLPIAVALISHPAVVAHHYEHGIDLRDDPFFSQEFTSPEYTTLVSEDPFEAHVEVPIDGDSIALSVDETLEAEAI